MSLKKAGFDEADAKSIIARAAELDAHQGHRIDARSLKDIATEAGIAPSAIDQAIAERSAPRPRRLGRVLFVIGGIVLALVAFGLMRITP
jgi:hypothetical protein